MAASWLIAVAVISSPAPAHEPLWGEAASTVGDRVYHPDIRFSYQPNGVLMNGTARVANPTGLSLNRVEQLNAIDYGIGPAWGVRLEVPVVRMSLRDRVNGIPISARYTDLGDLRLSARHRFYLRSASGSKAHQAVQFGLRLPTGRTSLTDNTGTGLAPDRQPGTGTLAGSLSYLATWENTKQTIWLSAHTEHSMRRRRFTPHADVEADATYGRWLKFPEGLRDLGTLLAVGLHGHWHGKERLPGGRDPNSGDSQFAIHTTFVAQQHQYQFRVGVLIPIRQGVNGTQLAERYEVRMGIEKFF